MTDVDAELAALMKGVPRDMLIRLVCTLCHWDPDAERAARAWLAGYHGYRARFTTPASG